MIKAVIFDLDNTVYDYDYCHNLSMIKLKDFACQKYSISEDVFEQAFSKAKRDVKNILGNTGSSHNRMLYMQLFLENININPVEDALLLYNLYWDSMLENMVVYPYVMPLLGELKNHCIKIGVLTDLTAHIQHRKIHKLGLVNYVDAIVTSEEVGVEKPDENAFARIQEKLGFSSDEILMIGDSLTKDVQGAENYGMNAIHFQSNNSSTMTQTVMAFINAKKS